MKNHCSKSNSSGRKSRVSPPRDPVFGDPPVLPALRLQVAVLRSFERYLRDECSLNDAATATGLNLAQFRAQIRDLFERGGIQIRLPLKLDREGSLNRAWPAVKHYYVLNTAPEEELFFRGAAEVFFDVLREFLNSHPVKKSLRIGLVSGRTTGGMINAICSHDGAWDDLLPMPKLPKEICIYALNSSQTGGYRELQGNANVLAFSLAERFIAKAHESKSIGPNDRPSVEAFGLSAKLLQAKKDVQETDCSPETRCILKYTDPTRLKDSCHACKQKSPDDLPDKSELDIVVTGVGSAGDSLFWQYGDANELNHKELVEKELVVGDIAYSPVTRMGEIKRLFKGDAEVEFYCAVSIRALQEMSQDPNKRVVLVARNGPSSKTEVIHAAIAPEKPVCNVMITDDPTAYDLLLRFSYPAGGVHGG